MTLTPLVTLVFAGASVTEHDDLAPGTANLGLPVWTASQLLANLELRLGLPRVPSARTVRVQHWSRRKTELEALSAGQFYARSHRVDAVGTAETLLDWRDELVMAGWNGESIPEGGPRIETLRQLHELPDLPAGTPDRLCHVERELRGLRATHAPRLDAIAIAEPRSLWPGRWQRVFALLEERGTSIRTTTPSFESVSGDSDLGHLQALLREDATGSTPRPARPLNGDGSTRTEQFSSFYRSFRDAHRSALGLVKKRSGYTWRDSHSVELVESLKDLDPLVVQPSYATDYPMAQSVDPSAAYGFDLEEVFGLIGEEGALRFRTHQRIERDRGLVASAMRIWAIRDPVLRCEVCSFSFVERYGSVGEAFIEAHHRKPLAELDGELTQVSIADLAAVCANCHRMLHRGTDVSIEALRRQILREGTGGP